MNGRMTTILGIAVMLAATLGILALMSVPYANAHSSCSGSSSSGGSSGGSSGDGAGSDSSKVGIMIPSSAHSSSNINTYNQNEIAVFATGP